MEMAVTAASRYHARPRFRERPDWAWLKDLPSCRRDGGMVYVTITIDPASLDGPASVAWSAGGVHAITPKFRGTDVTCCIPHGVFANRAQVKLQLLRSTDSEEPILAWTQIPVLGEALFYADNMAGTPVLSPVPAKKAASRCRAASKDAGTVSPSPALGVRSGAMRALPVAE